MNDERGAKHGFLSRLREQIEAEPVYFGFMALVLLYLSHALYTTFAFSRDDSAQFPRIVIGFTIAVILVDIALKISPGPSFGGDNSTDGLKTTQQLEMDPLGVFIAIVWVLGYAAAIYYIGFFTATITFVFSYVVLHDDGTSVPRRVLAGITWSLGITGFAWVLFVEFLKVSSVFRLGFLP